ncbi:transcription initiation factor IIA, gamma subunit, helical domain-containing protein [Immersiella caudata]|uniref:Transcription initiation factor IIA subunit 2 n=1 Tax=Immersiella caudata TaxID=314043 RepID=A0AA39WPF3_9PEZI|nr:transcription initiation factor IIA, gamma subunit, helical domain-containing protein [Immersiella caudata]
MPFVRVYSELYRSGSLGSTLIDTLEDLTGNKKIEPQLAAYILRQFDKTMEESFRGQTRAKMDINFKMDNNDKVHVKRMKVIAFSPERKEDFK